MARTIKISANKSVNLNMRAFRLSRVKWKKEWLNQLIRFLRTRKYEWRVYKADSVHSEHASRFNSNRIDSAIFDQLNWVYIKFKSEWMGASSSFSFTFQRYHLSFITSDHLFTVLPSRAIGWLVVAQSRRIFVTCFLNWNSKFHSIESLSWQLDRFKTSKKQFRFLSNVHWSLLGSLFSLALAHLTYANAVTMDFWCQLGGIRHLKFTWNNVAFLLLLPLSQGKRNKHRRNSTTSSLVAKCCHGCCLCGSPSGHAITHRIRE